MEASVAVIASDGEAIRTKQRRQSSRLDCFALLAMTMLQGVASASPIAAP
jgi:hypothetical protein